MYGDKNKYSNFMNYLSPEAQQREFNSQSPKSKKWLNIPRSPLPFRETMILAVLPN